MNGLPLDHIAVAVPSIAEAASRYERLTGTACSPVEKVLAQGVKVAFVGSVELLEPLGPDTPVGRFLRRNGPGLHHVAYRTADLSEELARLAGEGFELVDTEPRMGAGGHRVAFLHPRSTGKVLVELVERAP
ncbi:MAG TPA: methylmalonyl-CoA epimerase [Longimicrobiales bacterium]|jgi:methylmalonyl-CoA epimerase